MVKKLTLENGLRLVLAPKPGSLTATVLVLVEAGSEYEPKDKNGVFHFLEHMCFKRTGKRPKPGMLSAELESLGAEYNAYTSFEHTGYWAKAEAHKLPNIIEIVSDLYLNTVYEDDDIERERGAVIEEINMYEDMPMHAVQEVFTGLIYGDNPAGRPIAGTKETVRSISKSDFIDFRKKFYIAPSTIVVVSGGFEEKEIEKLVNDTFGHLPIIGKSEKPASIHDQKSSAIKVQFKESDQSHLVLGVRAFGIGDERRHALNVLSTVLGGGSSSRLWNKVREEMGAAYYISAYPEYFTDRGHLQISAGVANSKLETVIGAVIKEMTKLKNELIGDEELNKAKDHMVGRLIIGLETSDQFADFYGNQEVMTGKMFEIDHFIENIRKVTAQEVKDLANQLFKDEYLNLALVGPSKDSSQFENIVKFS